MPAHLALIRDRQPIGLTVWLALLFALCSQASASTREPQSDQTLHVEHSCDSLDPRVSATASCDAFLQNIYEGLTRIGKNGEVVAGLAKRWQLDAQNKTIEFTLHTDHHWSDGQPVTAQDVITAWSSILKQPLTRHVYFSELLAIQGAQAVVDQKAETPSGLSAPRPETLIVTFDSFNPLFPLQVAASQLVPIPTHAYQQDQERWAKQVTPPVNGLYQVSQHDGQYTLSPNPHHPNAKQLSITHAKVEQAPLGRIEHNKADLRRIFNQRPRLDYFILKDTLDDNTRHFIRSHQWEVYSTPVAAVRGLLANVKRLPAETIKTLKCAISSEKYVSRNQHENLVRADRFVILPDMVLPEAHWQGETGCKTHLTQQAAKARTQAPTPLRTVTFFHDQSFKSTLALELMLKPYGLKLISEQLSIKDYTARNVQGDYDVSLFTWQAALNDPSEFFGLRQAAKGWLDSETETAINQLMNEAGKPNDDARLQTLGRIETLMLEQGGLIPLAATETHFVVNNALCGFHANSYELVSYQDLHWCNEP